jgi:hypothetical protein
VWSCSKRRGGRVWSSSQHRGRGMVALEEFPPLGWMHVYHASCLTPRLYMRWRGCKFNTPRHCVFHLCVHHTHSATLSSAVVHTSSATWRTFTHGLRSHTPPTHAGINRAPNLSHRIEVGGSTHTFTFATPTAFIHRPVFLPI